MSDTTEKTFYCQECNNAWRTSKFDVDNDDVAYSKCNKCNTYRHEVPYYYFNIPIMQGKQTGPKSDEGKARVSLNAYKHGLFASNYRILAPAKKGKYPDCDGCPYYDDCTPDKYCPINLELITKFVAAYKNNDVKNLKEVAGLMQGNSLIIMNMLFKDILTHGTLVERIVSAKVEDNEAGDITKEEIVKEWQDNPSLKHFVKFMDTLGFTAEQQVMTPAKQTENENVKGFLDSENAKSETLQEHLAKKQEILKGIQEKIIKAGANRAKDKTLKEFKNQAEDDTDNE